MRASLPLWTTPDLETWNRALSEAEVERAMEGAFNRRPIWIRIGVLLAGVAMNFILAAGLFAGALSLPALIGHGPLHVIEVQEGSPAADAGLRAGDVITAVGDRPITTSTELTAAVRSAKPGDTVTLTVRRGDQTLTVDATLDEASD